MSERLRALVERMDIRVGVFHRDPERAHRIVARWLAPGGRTFAFFDPRARRGG